MVLSFEVFRLCVKSFAQDCFSDLTTEAHIARILAMTTETTETTNFLSRQVAANVRAEMGRQRVRQTQLAARLGVNDVWVSVRLRDAQPISLDDLQRIADALGVTIIDLLPEWARRNETKTSHAAGTRHVTHGPSDRRSPGRPAGSTRPSSSTRTARVH